VTRVLLVTNPGSGGAGDCDLDRVVDILRRAGDVATVTPGSTETFDDEVRTAAAGADLVAVAGGDGTMNRSVNALKERLPDLAVGLIPLGTGNDLARTMSIPTDPYEAADLIVDGADREIDVGRASGGGIESLFVNACIGGFPVAVDQEVDDDTKKRFGPLAYLVAGAKLATRLQRSTVVLNGLEVEECVAAGVGNGMTCGGGVRVWPYAAPDDGVLEGSALAAEGLSQALLLAAKVKLGKHEKTDNVRTESAATIAIDAQPALEINVDGELIGLRTPAEFTIVKRMRMKAPRLR
jgi:diacylglycerol kinase (ATP)